MSGIKDGHFYQRQFDCNCGVIAWSHRSRFELALKLMGDSPKRLLDYGCGDGTFLAMAADRVQQGEGLDLSDYMINSCKTRLETFPNLKFSVVGNFDYESNLGAYDVVTCMETLEHCIDPDVEQILQNLARLVSPEGKAIISVPIETGPTFLLKLGIRRFAGMRNLSDYRNYESYSITNGLKMLFADSKTAIERPINRLPDLPPYSHYGFNWRSMREHIKEHFIIDETHFSPLGFLGGFFSSQVWFVCRPR